VPPAQPSSGARALALLLIGLFIGAMVSLVASRSFQQKASYSVGLMTVLQQHHAALRSQVRRGQCDLPSAQLALDRLRLLTPDINQALADRGSLVAAMTDDLADAIALPGTDPAALCAALPAAVSAIDVACKACHSQLR
jgi:hypothetical protein